jgi:hypothetical protein
MLGFGLPERLDRIDERWLKVANGLDRLLATMSQHNDNVASYIERMMIAAEKQASAVQELATAIRVSGDRTYTIDVNTKAMVDSIKQLIDLHHDGLHQNGNGNGKAKRRK